MWETIGKSWPGQDHSNTISGIKYKSTLALLKIVNFFRKITSESIYEVLFDKNTCSKGIAWLIGQEELNVSLFSFIRKKDKAKCWIFLVLSVMSMYSHFSTGSCQFTPQPGLVILRSSKHELTFCIVTVCLDVALSFTAWSYLALEFQSKMMRALKLFTKHGDRGNQWN